MLINDILKHKKALFLYVINKEVEKKYTYEFLIEDIIFNAENNLSRKYLTSSMSPV